MEPITDENIRQKYKQQKIKKKSLIGMYHKLQI